MGFLLGKQVSLQGCPGLGFQEPRRAPCSTPNNSETLMQGPSPEAAEKEETTS